MNFLLAAALLLSPEDADRMAPPVGTFEVCEPARAKRWVGQKATTANISTIKAAMKANMVRILKPDMIVTMEYRFGRANILVDAKNRITRISCG